jgi:two-component system, OmpR family, sensor histidine kinase KdpD
MVTSSDRLRESILLALAHDLRGPLTSVVGLAESLLRLPPTLTWSQAEVAGALRDEALRMSELVSNSLDMVRIQGCETKLKREWQVLEEIIGGALRVSGRRLKTCQVTTAAPNDFPLLYFDAVLIERVLVNLIENAAKFAGPGAHVGIATVTRGAWADILVYDNGPGIPVGQEQSIFERFSRGEHTTGKTGLGLGLAICRALVEAHGGTICTSPSPGGGAGFTFSLPMEFSPPAMAPIDD